MRSSSPASWQDPRVLSILVVVFLCGISVGALGMRYRIHQNLHPIREQLWGPEHVQMSYEEIRTKLNLTPRQAEQVKSILDDFVKYHQEIDSQMQAQIEDFRATGRTRIMQVLTPEQQRKFEQLSTKMQSRLRLIP